MTAPLAARYVPPDTDAWHEGPPVKTKLFPAAELAARYGVLPKTIRGWARRRILPVIQFGSRTLRFDPDACDAALESRHMLAAQDPRTTNADSFPKQLIKRKNLMPRFNVTVRPYENALRPHFKWVVNCYHPTKGRQRAFFRTREQADAEAAARRIEGENYGLKALELTGPQRLEALAAFSLLKLHGATLSEAVTDFVQRRQGNRATFGEVTRLYLDSRKKLGRRPRYMSSIENVYSRLDKTFRDRRMSEISPGELQDWIDSQGGSAQTANHHRAMLHSLFQFALRRKIVRENVIKDIEIHQVKADKVGILTPDQMRALLRASLGSPDVLATLTLGGFAGLRPDEVARLQWTAINLDHGQIDCGSEVTKTARHRYVKIEPVLHAWLKTLMHPTPPTGMIQGPNFRRRLDAARRAAGFRVRATFVIKPGPDGEETASADEIAAANARLVEWPHDALRHSFASYHLAKFQDAAKLALELGHKSTGMLFSHYRERVQSQAAEAWWNLTPVTKE